MRKRPLASAKCERHYPRSTLRLKRDTVGAKTKQMGYSEQACIQGLILKAINDQYAAPSCMSMGCADTPGRLLGARRRENAACLLWIRT